MAYTHTLEVSVDGIRIEAELDFTKNNPHIKFVNPNTQMSQKEMHTLQKMVDYFCEVHCEHGEIHKIELIVKSEV